MQIDEFAAITQRIIAKDGFEDFQPTVCFPEQRSVRVLTGLPCDQDQETSVLEWATGIGRSGEEFLVVFKCDASHFKVVRKVHGSQECKIYAVAT